MPTMVIRIGELGEEAGHWGYRVELSVDGALSGSEFRPAASLPGRVVGADPRRALCESLSHQETVTLGEAFLHFLMDGCIGMAWKAEVARQPRGQNKPCALRTFLDVRSKVLRAWPWELMLSDDARYTFLDAQNLFLRGVPPPDGQEEGRLALPVRVLAVIGSVEEALRAEDEIDAIHRALSAKRGEWYVDVLRTPRSPEELFDRFDSIKPHVFHFIGHSGQEPATGLPGLRMTPLGGQGWYLTSSHILNAGIEVPRLAVLNACRSGGGDEETWARSASEALTEIRAAAVITMQSDIGSDPAVEFTDALYRQLAAGEPLDSAVREARQALFRRELVNPRDWARPCLTVNRRPEEVLAVRPGRSKAASVKALSQWYPESSPTVDRQATYRELWGGPEAELPDTRATVVGGGSQVGKSAFVRSAVFTWHLQGAPVVYADVSSRAASDHRPRWLDVVRLVRDRVTETEPQRAAGPRRNFDEQLGLLRRGIVPDESAPEGPGPAAPVGHGDDGGEWANETEHGPDLQAKVFTCLLELMRAVADDQRMLLVIDHLADAVEYDVHHVLVPHLLLPIAEANDDRLSAMVVDLSENLETLLPEEFRRLARRVSIGPLPRSLELMREYRAATGERFEGKWARMAIALADGGELTMNPGEFGLLDSLVRMSGP